MAVVTSGKSLAVLDAPNLAATRTEPARPARRYASAIGEAIAVLLSPLMALYALRLRAMAPVQLPDPSMHTTFIVQPRDIFLRYAEAFTPTARLREAADVGFLEPARIAYLFFGAIPGFFVTRYVFALIAIVPVYVLLKRLYGRGGGLVGIAVILTCPVIITAWGTDYPDSAVVSYVAGALACLAMPCTSRWRRGWVAAAVALLTLAAWAHGVGALIAITAMASYFFVRLLRERREIIGDVVLTGGTIVATTALLYLGSGVLIGHYNFIGPTFAALRYLGQASQIAMWHSASSRWAPYVTYILLPPAIVVGFGVVFARRLRNIATPQLFVGVATTTLVVVFFFMQFFNHVQTLEMHYFSSTLWAAVCLALAVIVCDLSLSLLKGRWGSWLPGATIVAVAFAYEADPHVPAFGWLPYGALVAAILIASTIAGRLARGIRPAALRWCGTVAAIVGITGCALVLTVARIPNHTLFPKTNFDPPPAYAAALGGSDANLVNAYRVTTELPDFVGAATYPGEQLLMSLPHEELRSLLELIGMYHAGYDLLPSTLPVLSAGDKIVLGERRPAEILVLATSSNGANGVLVSLAPYRARLLRSALLHSGSFKAYVWLYYLDRFGRPTTSLR